jgi:hypothetical protein
MFFLYFSPEGRGFSLPEANHRAALRDRRRGNACGVRRGRGVGPTRSASQMPRGARSRKVEPYQWTSVLHWPQAGATRFPAFAPSAVLGQSKDFRSTK